MRLASGAGYRLVSAIGSVSDALPRAPDAEKEEIAAIARRLEAELRRRALLRGKDPEDLYARQRVVLMDRDGRPTEVDAATALAEHPVAANRVLTRHDGTKEMLSAQSLAHFYFNDPDPYIFGLARALEVAATYEADVRGELQRATAEAFDETCRLMQAIEVWNEAMEPLVAEHRRVEERVATHLAARMEVTPPWWSGLATVAERVDRVRSAVPELAEIARAVARQVEHPQMLLTEQHRPTDHIHNKIIQQLNEVGFTQKEIGRLVFGDQDPEGAADRVRKRLKRLRASSRASRK
jgi:hypothetical protein